MALFSVQIYLVMITLQTGVIELDGDSSSEAGSLSSEEGSASSDNSEAASEFMNLGSVSHFYRLPQNNATTYVK